MGAEPSCMDFKDVEMKVTCEITDYSKPAKPNIRVHNGFYSEMVELEVREERYIVSADELISAIKRAKLDYKGE